MAIEMRGTIKEKPREENVDRRGESGSQTPTQRNDGRAAYAHSEQYGSPPFMQ